MTRQPVGVFSHESGGEGSSSTQSRVEESGEGLTEFLEEMGKRDGVAAVIEYLRHTNIRFYDGEGHGFRRYETKRDSYERTLRFLRLHLAGAAE